MKKVKEETLELWTPIGSTFYRAPESFVLGYGETVDMWAAGVVAF
jgi:serine/threonine protein kinase